jgi:hypothetical protein
MIDGHSVRWNDPGTWPWIFWAILLAMLARWIKPVWLWLRNQLAQNWPEAQGRINAVSVEAKNESSGSGDPFYRAKLFYSYDVGGQDHQGRWQRDFDTEHDAEEFVRDLEGKPVIVVYSPRRPSWSTLLQDAVVALTNTRPPRPEGESGQRAVVELPPWLRPVVQTLMAMATVGLGLSLWVHFAALGGHKVASDALFTGLHLGIFIVCFPAALLAGRRSGSYQKVAWKTILKGLPLWIRLAVWLFSGYATISFFIFFFPASSRVSSSGGSGTQLMDWRGFSGHWMAFYSWALAVLYSTIHTPNESNVPRQHQKVS